MSDPGFGNAFAYAYFNAIGGPHERRLPVAATIDELPQSTDVALPVACWVKDVGMYVMATMGEWTLRNALPGPDAPCWGSPDTKAILPPELPDADLPAAAATPRLTLAKHGDPRPENFISRSLVIDDEPDFGNVYGSDFDDGFDVVAR